MRQKYHTAGFGEFSLTCSNLSDIAKYTLSLLINCVLLLHTKACLSVLHVICRLYLIIFLHNSHHTAVFILNVTPVHIFSNVLSSQISSCQKQNHSE